MKNQLPTHRSWPYWISVCPKPARAWIKSSGNWQDCRLPFPVGPWEVEEPDLDEFPWADNPAILKKNLRMWVFYISLLEWQGVFLCIFRGIFRKISNTLNRLQRNISSNSMR